MAPPHWLQGVAPPAPPAPPAASSSSSCLLIQLLHQLLHRGQPSSLHQAQHPMRHPPGVPFKWQGLLQVDGESLGCTSWAPVPPHTSAPLGPRSLCRATLLCHTYMARSKGHWAGG